MRAKLGTELVRTGAATSTEVDAALIVAARTHQRLGEVLIESSIVDEREIYRSLATLHGLRFATSDELVALIEASLSSKVPVRFQEYNRVLPISLRNGTLLVATSEPNADLPELGHALHAERVEQVVVTPTDLHRLRTALSLDRAGSVGDVPAAPRLPTDILAARGVNATSAESLFDELLLDAIAERASDLHVETYRGATRIRIRVDGDLRDLPMYRLDDLQRLSLINVIKVRAGIDIAERRVPQGGRITTRAANKSFDIRVQTQPCLHGEHVVLRLLPQDAQLVSIPELGFPPALAKAYRRLLDSPGGLLLVVGPTGSGKSTTLYAGLQVLAADPSRKVITVEDPIEYALDGVQQTQVHTEIGVDFAHAMRAFVREDPDVILVGEIRDGETALEAIRASQTGHLVLSTLHCNDTIDAVQRLTDLGQNANSIASELLAVISQRLARRICESCRTPDTRKDNPLVQEIFPGGVPAEMKFFVGKGCERCHGTGAFGRIAAVEFLPASVAFRVAVGRRATVDELRQEALRSGLVPLRDHALELARTGIIAIDELKGMLPPERLAPERSEPLP